VVLPISEAIRALTGWFVLAAVFAIGFIAQRGTTCAVIAARHLVLHRRPERFMGFLLCAIVGIAVVALAKFGGNQGGMVFAGRTASVVAAPGGATIGIGAWINGRCTIGTIAGLGSGDLCRIGTIAGFLGGAFIISRFVPSGIGSAALSPLANASPLAIAAGAASVAALLALRLRSRDHQAVIGDGWPLIVCMPIIGLINGYLLIASRGWAYTALLGDVAMGHWMGIAGRLLIFAALVGGAIIGGIASGSFILRRGSGGQWFAAVIGGAVMGWGTILVPGGNDTMLLVGLPLLIPNLLLGYVSMYATLMLLIAAED